MMTRNKPDINVLQAGRAIAALAVLAYHLSLMMMDAGYSAVGRSVTWRGDLGVDFFFVLSGFIIAYAHEKDIGKPAALPRYLYRRFVRLYPIYWLYSLAMIVLLVLFAANNRPPEGWAEWATTILLVRLSSAPTPIHPAWTLFHEIAFYAVFAVLILSRRAGIVLLGLWAMWCLITYHYVDEFHRTALLTYSSAMNLNFLVGIGAHALYRRGWRPVLLSVGGGVLCVVTFVAEAVGSEPSPLLYAVGLGALISGIATLETRGTLSVPKTLGLLGNASYSIYLTHEMIGVILLRIAKRLPHAVPHLAIYLGIYGLTVAAGVLAYWLLEKRITDYLRRFTPRGAPAGA